MRPVDVVILLMAAFFAVTTLLPAFCRCWDEYTVACGTAFLLSSLATLPKRYGPSNEKPWRLVSK